MLSLLKAASLVLSRSGGSAASSSAVAAMVMFDM